LTASGPSLSTSTGTSPRSRSLIESGLRLSEIEGMNHNKKTLETLLSVGR
jgi:hypothetical protein